VDAAARAHRVSGLDRDLAVELDADQLGVARRAQEVEVEAAAAAAVEDAIAGGGLEPLEDGEHAPPIRHVRLVGDHALDPGPVEPGGRRRARRLRGQETLRPGGGYDPTSTWRPWRA
jgi:hypothetical protein